MVSILENMNRLLLLAGLSACLIASTQGASLTDGLVLHYPFDGESLDRSNFRNHGTLYNGAEHTTDRFGRTDLALHFNGAGAYVEAINALPASDSLTVSVWFSLDAWMPAFGAPQVVFFEGDDGGGRDVACYVMSGLGFNVKSDTSTTIKNWLPPTNTWVHLVCVADATAQSSSLWVNGVKQSEDFFPGGANQGFHSRFNLGRRPGGYNDWFFAGQMDDVRVYDRALSGSEIANLHDVERGVIKALQIEIETLRLTLNVTPNVGHLLQSSTDLRTWTAYGEPFTPTQSRFTVTVNAQERGRYWRLVRF